MNRRNFFEKFVGALFGGTVLAFVAPALAYLFPNRNFGATGREFSEATGEVISANSIPQGGSRVGMLAGKPAIVLRQNGEVVALSAVCTHLGCTVAFNASANQFQCPCHGGKYDRDGNVVAGPPPKPLERLQIRVDDDKIILS
jgi:cytochrome b6-f complex iron-sulfur subunit